jgi:CubicO group peptidase (beta-lactamase class C family)
MELQENEAPKVLVVRRRVKTEKDGPRAWVQPRTFGVSFSHRFLVSATLALTLTTVANAQCDVTAQADQYFQPLVKSRKAYAAALVYVQDGAPPQLRVYGNRVSERTLWRAASVSKALTALAVMRLAEQGKLPLDSDIRDFVPTTAIRSHYDHPVTIRELLLHQGGVDDHFIGDGFSDGQQPTMTQIVSERPLDVVYEPGKIELYSNYGYALLGAAIEKASGERYEQYMQTHVLQPLGMNDSSFQQPLPTGWRSRVAPGKWVYQHAAPAAALTTSANDMGRFLSATLNRASSVISPESFNQMVPPSLEGVRLMHGLGYWTGQDRGQRLVAASGDIEQFHNVLVAFPELRSGFSVMISGPSNSLAWGFYARFMDACVPPARKAAPTSSEAMPASVNAERIGGVAGLYRTVRYPHHELSKTFILFDLTKVSVRRDGSLDISGQHCVRTPGQQYQPETGGPALAFLSTSDGKQFIVQPGSPAREKIHWFQTGWIAVLSYFGCIGVFIVGFVKSRRCTRIIYGIALVYGVGWLATVLIVGPSNLILGLPIILQCFLALGTALPALFIASIFVAGKTPTRYSILLALSLLPFSMVVWYWHLYWP